MLIDRYGEVKEIDLSKNRVLLYNFSRPCTTCDRNFGLWKRIAQRFGKDLSVLGVVETRNDVDVVMEMLTPQDYSIYLPYDVSEYTEMFNRTTTLSQTIYIASGTVQFSFLGELQMEDYNRLISKIDGY